MAGETGTVQITIPNLEQFQNALLNFSQVAIPIVNTAILQGAAILATNTVPPNVPWKTGNLAHTFALQTGPLFARWFPTASYAGDVYFGTKPHVIKPVNAKALFWPGLAHPVKSVKHPGTQPDPYLDRIAEAAEPEIIAFFQTAIQKIIAATKQ